MKARSPILAIPGLALLFTACLDKGSPTSAARGNAAEDGASDGMTPVFSEAFADGGDLRVVSDDAGQIQFVVQAPIGSKAERLLAQSAGQPNLAEVYRTLHEGAKPVPLELQKASDRVEALKKAAPVSEAGGPAAEALAKSAQSADANSFKTGYCRDFTEGNITYRMNGCTWCLTCNWVETSANLNSDGTLIDRSYGWNNTGWTATMSNTKNTWKPTIPPYTVYWVQWGGVYTGARATLTLPAGKWNEIGITSHRAWRMF